LTAFEFPAPWDRFVGVGLGIDVHNEQPDWRSVLADLDADFLEVYTRGDVQGGVAVRKAAAGLPLLYHDDALDPILPEGLREADLQLAVQNLEATGAPWCVSELATRRLGERYLDFFLPILLTPQAAHTAADSLARLDAALPGRVAAENPPYQLPVGPLHVLEVMALVHERAHIPLVLDLGHLYSFQLCRGLDPLDSLDALPLEAVIELHVAGATVDERHGPAIYQDAHGASEVLPVIYDMLAEIAPRCPELRAVTIEVEDAPMERVARQLVDTRAALAR
jgi:uncharacterized protein (UPF0276 family)